MKTTLCAVAAAAALFTAAPAEAANKAELLRDANLTVNHLKSDPAFATAARMLRDARAVYVVPHLVKGGFIFGAEGGSGVLVPRAARGWGEPRFYDMASASFGFQAGLEKAELVFIINSEKALRGIEAGNFKIGGQAGITVATLSSGAEGATTAHGGDMVVWSSGTGLFGGVAFNGSVISPDKDLNATPTTGREAVVLRANLASVR
ncbi:MAG: lipid-binding SYLF domain-containing protein [Alphaproteobacteria bacterium]|nr:lipid-binding SYLF domain-containing protein [Alphaproteobacteria bacterium]